MALGRNDRMNLLQRLLGLDWIMLGAVSLLLGMGLALIDSATFAVWGRTLVVKQGIWVVAGVVAYACVAAVPAPALRHFAGAGYVVSLLAVVLTYGIGEESFGARRWLRLAGVRFQPSEFLKIASVLVLASVAARYVEAEDNEGRASALGLMAVVSAVSFVAIVKQPDLGTAATVLAAAGGMLIVMGLPLAPIACLGLLGALPVLVPAVLARFEQPVTLASVLPMVGVLTLVFFAGAGLARALGVAVTLAQPFAIYAAASLGLALGPAVWSGLNPYQRLRLTGFLAPELDPRGSGYNLIQSLIAIGSGGIWGQGLRKGAQTNLGFVPHKHTDFIFSVCGEELGFVGVAVLLGAFALLLARMFWIAARARTPFGSIAVAGSATLLAFQVLVNLGMSMGLAPITGLPLPFVSYGGSAMLGSFVLLGVAQSVAWDDGHARGRGGS